MPAFRRYIGIHYSGAEVPTALLPALCVYLSDGGGPAVEVRPAMARHWSRRAIAGLLVDELAGDVPTLMGIDHGFSFPKAYFDAHGLAPDWPAFLDDFRAHWPTDTDIYVDFVREGVYGDGAARSGDTSWRRLTERRAGRTRSLFHFQSPRSVAKATHAGLPWLRFIHRRLGARVHVWPFDGWDIAAGRSAIVEVYPPLWRRHDPRLGRTRDRYDAAGVASWLAEADRTARLSRYLRPRLTTDEDAIARIEGWILGVE